MFPSNFEKFPSNLYGLTQEGIDQANSAGIWLKKNVKQVDQIFSSTALRCTETAFYSNILKYYTNAGLRTDPRIVEINWGDLDNTPYEDREKYAIRFMKRGYDGLSFCPPGGETIIQGMMRAHNFHQMLCRQHAGQSIVVFTHGGLMDCHALSTLKDNGLTFHEKVQNSVKPYRNRNCQIVEWTTENPWNGEISDKYTFFRSVCPWDPNDEAIWEPIFKTQFTHETLGDFVNQTRERQVYPALLELDIDPTYLQNL